MKPQFSRSIATPFLVIGLLLFEGLHFVWARVMHDYLPPLAAVTWYFIVAAIEVGVFAAWRGQLRLSTLRKRWWFFALVGGLVATSTSINYIAVGYIDPSTGTLLNQSVVVYNLVLGAIWLKDRLTKPQLLGAALCIVGVAIISFQPGDFLRIGTVLVLTSSFFYAIHAVLVKKYGGNMDFLDFFAWRIASTMLMSFVATTAWGQWALPRGLGWFWLLVAATTDVVLSRALYYMSLRRLKISLHTLILTMSPVMAAIWSFLLFNLHPTIQQVIGGIVVMLGVATVSFMRAKE